jgi:predicted outer membrane repeat protein
MTEKLSKNGQKEKRSSLLPGNFVFSLGVRSIAVNFMKKTSWRYLSLLGLAWWVGAASAATITVNSASQDIDPGGVCTLRGAVDAMNNGADTNSCTATGAYGNDDTIRFNLGTATITLGIAANNHITVRTPLTIDGSGNDITLDGNNANRIFYAVNGCTALTIRRLTFRDGNSGATNAVGGAIAVEITSAPPNTLIVEDSVFIDNQAHFFGGAIDITDNNNLSTLLVKRSTFTNNAASLFQGGAIWAYSATIRDSTFSGNSAGTLGGAVRANDAEMTNSTFVNNTANGFGGAIHTESSLIATHLTLVNNSAPTGAAIHVVGTIAAPTIASLKNSLIVGGNGVTTAQCEAGANATLDSGTNLEWRDGVNENSCNSSTPVTTTVALLEDIVDTVLANHGGPTFTLALPDNSPAIDTGDPSVGLATDQRGQLRPQGNGPDLGAFEKQLLTPPTPIAAASIPALGVWSLLALLGLVPVAACRARRRM